MKVAADSSSAEATDIQGIYASFYSAGDVTNSGVISVDVDATSSNSAEARATGFRASGKML